jgi:hypothetical protein
MATDALVVLDQLRCIREDDWPNGHSEPYIWPALLWIDDAGVNVEAPAPDSARLVVKDGMRAGEVADLPGAVATLSARIVDGFRAAILVVALWENDESPGHVVTAGFQAFADELGAAVRANLAGLAGTEEERARAIAEITDRVDARVESTIEGALTWWEKVKFLAGELDLDDIVGSDTSALTTLPPVSAPAPLSLAFGLERGGNLLVYRDRNRDGTGEVDVATPMVIGRGGWQDHRFLFPGGDGIIYAVDGDGRLLFYRDEHRDGTGDVANPRVIGLGGWADYRFLFSGGDGIIYAVDGDGRLLFYRDEHRDGTGDVASPSVIGLGGWADQRFLFSGGDGIIYAVDHQAQLLFYRDRNRDGTGDVADPATIGVGEWLGPEFPFPRGFRFLFSGGDGIIYAVDKLQQSGNRYELDAHLEVRAPAQIAFSRETIDFGLLGVGEAAFRTLRITSVGLAPVTLDVPGSPALGPFSWAGLQTALAPGASVDLGVEFSPLGSGKAEGMLRVVSDAQGSPHAIALSGSGRKVIQQ